MYLLLLPLILGLFSSTRDIHDRIIQSGTNYYDVHEFVKGALPRDDANRWWPEPESDKKERHYDFLVLGAGHAGCVIASRLSEIPNWSVLLLEAGQEADPITEIPALTPLMQFTRYNWAHLTEPQDNFAKGVKDRRTVINRGKALGGSSVTSYMTYHRGLPEDYDRWAELGNPGWSYSDVLRYFLKSEDASEAVLRGGGDHAKGGEWSVDYPGRTPLDEAFMEGGADLGYKFEPDLKYTRRGRRDSVARAFLSKRRKNLRVQTGSFATRLLTNKLTHAVVGVEYLRNGRVHKAYAKKEVIVCLGSIGSPKLLLLSGIGPKQHLKNLNIPVIADLPVGQRYYDHIAYSGLSYLINENVEMSLPNLISPMSLMRWMVEGKGVTNSSGSGSLGFISTESERHGPNIQLLLSSVALGSDFGVKAKSYRIRKDVYLKYWGPILGKPAFTIYPVLIHPKSCGNVSLSSAHPLAPPKITGNFLTKSADREAMVLAIRFIQKLTKTAGFKKYNSTLYNAPVPGCESHAHDSDAYWICALETLSTEFERPMGTCSMGTPEDAASVVNHQLKVYGVKGLRVAGMSVAPLPIGARPGAPSVMIGEKAAQMIREDWGKREAL